MSTSEDDEPSSRRSLIWVAGACVLLAVIGLALVYGGVLTFPGKAFRPATAGYMVENSRVGQTFMDGFAILRLLPGHERVRLDGVAFIGDVEGLRLVEARLANPTEGVNAYSPDYPPEHSDDPWTRRWFRGLDRVRPAAGATLVRRANGPRDHELILGIEVIEPGRWERTAIRVDYTENGIRRRQDLGFTVVVCTPEGLVDDACLNPFGEPVPVD